MHSHQILRPFHFLAFLLLAGGVVLPSSPAQATPGRFGYDKCINFRLTPEEIAEIKADLNNLPDGSRIGAKEVISVPVYIHIIQDSGNSNPTTVDQITSQMTVLNNAYAKAGFSFFLAGIETVVNDTWAIDLQPGSSEADQMKSSLRQGDQGSLNIYLTGLGGGLLGYATFPWDYTEYPEVDGIVVLSTSLPGGAAFPYDKGRTVVHEAGHWFGLFHTFQPSSANGNGCRGSGDWTSDTPAEKEPHYACKRIDSCKQKGLDPIHNFMSYTTDACQTKFTKGQGNLIQDMWSLYRAQ